MSAGDPLQFENERFSQRYKQFNRSRAANARQIVQFITHWRMVLAIPLPLFSFFFFFLIIFQAFTRKLLLHLEHLNYLQFKMNYMQNGIFCLVLLPLFCFAFILWWQHFHFFLIYIQIKAIFFFYSKCYQMDTKQKLSLCHTLYAHSKSNHKSVHP